MPYRILYRITGSKVYVYLVADSRCGRHQRLTGSKFALRR